MEKEEKIKLTGFACQKCRREISKEEGEFTEKSGQVCKKCSKKSFWSKIIGIIGSIIGFIIGWFVMSRMTMLTAETKSKFIIELENDLRVNRCDLEKYFIIHVPSELKILGKTGNSLTARMETALYKDLNKVINNGKTEMSNIHFQNLSDENHLKCFSYVVFEKNHNLVWNKYQQGDGISHRDFYLNFKAADYQDFSTREEAVRFLRTSDTYFQQIK